MVEIYMYIYYYDHMKKFLLSAILLLCASSVSVFAISYDAHQHFLLATGYAEKGQYEKAITEYNKAISFDNNYSDAYWHREITNIQLRKFDNAVYDFSKVIELTNNPHNKAAAYWQRGRMKAEQGKFNEALQDNLAAIKNNPDFYYPYYDIAVIKSAQNDFKTSAEYFEKTINILNSKQQKNNDIIEYLSNSYSGLSRCQIVLGSYNDAINNATKAINIYSNHPRAYGNRALAKTKLKDYKGAMDDYAKSIELNPNDPAVYFNRAEIREKVFSDYKGAKVDREKAKKLLKNYLNNTVLLQK